MNHRDIRGAAQLYLKGKNKESKKGIEKNVTPFPVTINGIAVVKRVVQSITCPFIGRSHSRNRQQICHYSSLCNKLRWMEITCFDSECSSKVQFTVTTPQCFVEAPRSFAQLPLPVNRLNAIQTLIQTSSNQVTWNIGDLKQFGRSNFLFQNHTFQQCQSGAFSILCTRFVICQTCHNAKIHIRERDEYLNIFCNHCKIYLTSVKIV